MLVKPQLFRRPRVEMVPLIDMFFLILVFFIFGVFSMTMQEGLVVNLPSAQTAAVVPEEPALTISVTPDGALSLNRHPTTVEELPRALREATAGADRLVTINADRAAAHGAVIGALDAVRQAGLFRVSFQTVPEAP